MAFPLVGATLSTGGVVVRSGPAVTPVITRTWTTVTGQARTGPVTVASAAAPTRVAVTRVWGSQMSPGIIVVYVPIPPPTAGQLWPRGDLSQQG